VPGQKPKKAASAYFNPEQGYGTSEQKEKIEQAGK
jgi:hypothetical protein